MNITTARTCFFFSRISIQSSSFLRTSSTLSIANILQLVTKEQYKITFICLKIKFPSFRACRSLKWIFSLRLFFLFSGNACYFRKRVTPSCEWDWNNAEGKALRAHTFRERPCVIPQIYRTRTDCFQTHCRFDARVNSAWRFRQAHLRFLAREAAETLRAALPSCFIIWHSQPNRV